MRPFASTWITEPLGIYYVQFKRIMSRVQLNRDANPQQRGNEPKSRHALPKHLTPNMLVALGLLDLEESSTEPAVRLMNG